MNKDEFLTLVRDELDLPMETADLSTDFDQMIWWDSMHLLRLVTALERETGVRLKIGSLMTDRTLSAVYERVAA